MFQYIRAGLEINTSLVLVFVQRLRIVWQFSETIYTLSQKNVPPLQLAIIFTYTVRLRQFLAQMLPKK